MESLHEKTKTGFTEGSLYDQGRPSYTSEGVEHILSILDLDSLAGPDIRYDVLELGAGTGKFTSKIVEKLPESIRYFATEPMDDLRRQLAVNCPTVEIGKCVAKSIPLPDCSVKAVIAAQCFHWFATEESLVEIRRVLVTGGKLVFIWNNKDRSVPWAQSMEDVLSLYYDADTPRAIRYEWKAVVEKYDGFRDHQYKFLPGLTFKGSREFIVDHYSTISVINSLDDATKRKARKQFQNVIDNDPSLADERDAITLPMNSCRHKTFFDTLFAVLICSEQFRSRMSPLFGSTLRSIIILCEQALSTTTGNQSTPIAAQRHTNYTLQLSIHLRNMLVGKHS
ncbi:hypothetical protein ScPMuIL_007742 [Solemya velum]